MQSISDYSAGKTFLLNQDFLPYFGRSSFSALLALHFTTHNTKALQISSIRYATNQYGFTQTYLLLGVVNSNECWVQMLKSAPVTSSSLNPKTWRKLSLSALSG